MKRIEEVLEEMGIKYNISEKNALVEFWTDTAGQDIPTEFEFDGTPEDFVEQFANAANSYDVDDEVELYAEMKGQRGVPDTITEILADCQEAKNTLLSISKKLERAISEKDMDVFLLKIGYSWDDEEPDEEFDSEEQAWDKALSLAIKEANVSSEEHACSIPLFVDSKEKKIMLYYSYDNEWCRYSVIRE